jgi:NADH:ubiquinone oxidoreductase subunit D
MEYKFDVEVLESGQRRAYGDSYFRYRIVNNSEVDYSDHVIKSFCTGFLRVSISEAKRKELIKKEDTMSSHFTSYFTKFEKTDERTFEYEVTEPSTH